MIVTNNFVYLHHPKTGGTFVTKMLHCISERVPWFHCEEIPGAKHAGIRRIPQNHKSKLVVMNVRNVFDHYASRFAFRWWANDERAANRFNLDKVNRDFPDFPNVTFSEFLRLLNDWNYRNSKKHRTRNRNLERLEVGHCSYALLRMSQKHVMKILRRLDEMTNDQFRSRFANIRFLRTERLNDDLADLLKEEGIPDKEVEFIREKDRILPVEGGRGKAVDWRQYFSDQDVQLILQRDRIYFRLFPDMLPTGVQQSLEQVETAV